MTKYLILLRGINVGGHRKIVMKDLKTLLLRNDFTEVTTYIQSGNIVCYHPLKDTKALESKVQDLILDSFGHEVPAVIRTSDEWVDMIEQNPFKTREIDQLYCAFLSDDVPEEVLVDLQPYATKGEEFSLVNRQLFLSYPVKVHLSKLNNSVIEKKLKTTATIRNWKTVLKLRELLD
jgi:uncharacterized protein (DUF1697 family)